MRKYDVQVLGIGDRLRGDHALGPVVADTLARRLACPVREHSGESLSLIERLGESRVVILVDAVPSDARPGRIHRIDLTGEPLTVSPGSFSTQALSLPEALELARTLGRLPERVLFFGVEASAFEIGAPLSAAVAAALPSLLDRITREVAEIGHVPEVRMPERRNG